MTTLTPEEVEARRTGLGGSDALAYCGKDPRCTPLDLYREKIGEAPPHDLGERAEWGSRLEPVVRDWLADDIGRPIYKPSAMYRSGDVPMMLAHLDGLVTGSPEEGAEIKVCDKYLAAEYGEPGTDQVPLRHVLQCTHYMVVTGIRRWHLGVLVGGNDARHYVLNFDPELAGMLIAQARLFWAHVETRQPPDPVSLADAAIRWPRSTERLLKAPETITAAVESLRELRRAERVTKLQADSVELSLKAFMGEAAILTDDEGHKLATWRQQTREMLDAKALAADHPDLAARYRRESSFRVFLLK